MREKRIANKTSKTKSDGRKGSSRLSWSNGGGDKARNPVTREKLKIKGGGNKKINEIGESPSKTPVRTRVD